MSAPEAFRWLMGQPQGRVALKWLAATAGLTEGVFHANNSQMSFNEGRRSVAVDLFAVLRAADQPQYLKIIGELL